MKLAKNIVRVNGYDRDGKRTHIDFEVPTRPNDLNWGKGDVIPRYTIWGMVDKAFESGLAGVTSVNAYNHVADMRMTHRVY